MARLKAKKRQPLFERRHGDVADRKRSCGDLQCRGARPRSRAPTGRACASARGRLPGRRRKRRPPRDREPVRCREAPNPCGQSSTPRSRSVVPSPSAARSKLSIPARSRRRMRSASPPSAIARWIRRRSSIERERKRSRTRPRIAKAVKNSGPIRPPRGRGRTPQMPARRRRSRPRPEGRRARARRAR